MKEKIYTGKKMGILMLAVVIVLFISSVTVVIFSVGKIEAADEAGAAVAAADIACLIGGIIWGLWHFPIDISNYLGGYGSFSFSMKLAFGRLVLLTCFGVFLMWLTKKTDSIFPAVVAHFMFNASQNAIMELFMQSDIPEDTDLGKLADVFQYVPMAVLAVIFMLLLFRAKTRGGKLSDPKVMKA